MLTPTNLYESPFPKCKLFHVCPSSVCRTVNPLKKDTMAKNFSCKNQTTNLTLDPCGDDGTLQVLLAVSYSIIFILGLVGNLVALWVFFCVHSKKNSVRVFLINIALADLLLVVCLPFRILYHSQGDKWNLDPTVCNVVGHLFYMNMYISITLLGLISVDRYFKIHQSVGMQCKLCSTKLSFALCAIVWIVSTCIISVMVSSTNDSPHVSRLVKPLNLLFFYLTADLQWPTCVTKCISCVQVFPLQEAG